MNNKLLAVIVVVILAVAGVSAYVLLSDNSNKDVRVNLLAGVNNEGSGIYIDQSYDVSEFIEFNGNGEVVRYIPDGWRGKVFGVPGVASIQYIQLLEIVTSELGFQFKTHDSGATGDVVFYRDGINTADLAVTNRNEIDGGILWQPQFQNLADGAYYKKLATTDVLFPDHICCVLAGNMNFVEENADAVVDFLSAIIKADKWLNNAMSNEGGEDYAKMMEIAKRQFPNLTETVIKESLESVVYTYGDDTNNPLSSWRAQIKDLVDSLDDLGQLYVSLDSLGFNNSTEFAGSFVNDTYLKQALADDSMRGDGKTKIRVSLINGDIHQFAIQLAMELGYFEEYNLEIQAIGAGAGVGVITQIKNQEADLGLLGAPPLTINTINSKLISA